MQAVVTTHKKLHPGEMDVLMPRLCDFMLYGLPRAPSEPGRYTRPTYVVCVALNKILLSSIFFHCQ